MLRSLGLAVAATCCLGSMAAADAPPRVRVSARPDLRVVALGDSVVSAAHCSCPGFMAPYAAATARATGSRVAAWNLGRSGLTSGGLLRQLATADGRAAVAAGDVVVVMVGANDVAGAMAAYEAGTCSAACVMRTVPGVRARVTQIGATVRRLRAGRPTELLVLTYWNVVQDGRVARAEHGAGYRALSDRLTRATNVAICAGARATGAACVDTYAPFKADGRRDPTPLLAADGDHPNISGHAVIAAALARHRWRELGR